MSLKITAIVERWPVAGQFVISRGAKTYVDVLVVGVSDGTHIGQGEGTAIYYESETAERCLGQVMQIADALQEMACDAARLAVQDLLPRGAARNALDCTLWDLAAKQADQPLWRLAGMADAPKALHTAFTISLDEPAVMERHAAEAAAKGYSLLKLKLTGQGDRTRVAAVRAGAPGVRLIVDANESWDDLDVAAEASALIALGVEMIEQPVKAGNDVKLAGVRSPLPLVADESCHTVADISICARYYDGVNIKLDKAGGLTEALKLKAAAQNAGMKVMVGCMLSTSLGIAPAFLAAQGADWVDLDGPALLAQDREDGFRFDGGMVSSHD
jgi:L-alanine-DL-glutamate epimerase-like enolase superfamily enzyme